MKDRMLKKIQILFLLMAVLVFVAHNIIPHDHHISDSPAGKEESCPSSQGGAGHHGNFPAHCHAFNDLTSEKVSINILPYQTLTRDISTKSHCDSISERLQIIFLLTSNYPEPVHDAEIVGCKSLRAPPSLS